MHQAPSPRPVPELHQRDHPGHLLRPRPPRVPLPRPERPYWRNSGLPSGRTSGPYRPAPQRESVHGHHPRRSRQGRPAGPTPFPRVPVPRSQRSDGRHPRYLPRPGPPQGIAPVQEWSHGRTSSRTRRPNRPHPSLPRSQRPDGRHPRRLVDDDEHAGTVPALERSGGNAAGGRAGGHDRLASSQGRRQQPVRARAGGPFEPRRAGAGLVAGQRVPRAAARLDRSSQAPVPHDLRQRHHRQSVGRNV
mmetsp:Transcript_46925/g.87123  ORF Transcript_46925/g.87123 Transcript_46925/m.87123 type:complete len:247 (-) Transcript_46925:243-983(-)